MSVWGRAGVLVARTRGAQNHSMQQQIPEHVGPCEFGTLGRQIAVRCPVELARILQRAGAIWAPGSRRWLMQRHRIGPVIRRLQKTVDPLFKFADVAL